MSNKIITAEEFFALPDYDKSSIPMFSDIHNAMIEFAKLHVQEALKQASEKVKLDDGDYISDGFYETMIDKESILNAYPLENIK